MPPKSYAFFRGEYVPATEAKVSIMTHALHYGTAVFEGIRGNWNPEKQVMYIFRLREHYQRLLNGCKMLMLDIPYSLDDLCRVTVETVERSGYNEDVYIRPIAFKSEERVANLKLHELSSDFGLIVVPFGKYLGSEALRCCTSSWRRVDDPMIPPRLKISGIYVNSILAKTEAVLAGFDEAILLNQSGYVSEGTGENLFLVNGGRIHTPSMEDNPLGGITRDCAITLARDLGYEVREMMIPREMLYVADELFFTGTAAEISPIRSVDKQPIGSGSRGPITRRLQEEFFGITEGRIPDRHGWLTYV